MRETHKQPFYQDSYGYIKSEWLTIFIIIPCVLLFLGLGIFISMQPETTVKDLVNSHPAFAGLDCELMRSYISYNTNAHNHDLLIYAERCL